MKKAKSPSLHELVMQSKMGKPDGQTQPSGPVIHVRQDPNEEHCCLKLWFDANKKEYVCSLLLNHAGPCQPVPKF